MNQKALCAGLVLHREPVVWVLRTDRRLWWKWKLIAEGQEPDCHMKSRDLLK